MIEQQRLHGTALYNPHLHGKDELVSLFVARRELLDLLVEDLRATASGKTPQHHLILGQRGMGKTMLLRRLAYAVEDDPALGGGWLPLTFPEEQYNVARLSDFWLNCADSLSDLLESKGRHCEAEQLDEAAAVLRSLDEETRAKRSLALLVATAQRMQRRLLLLVDNADLILERVGEQEWTLREALAMEPTLVFVGASASAIETSFNYGKAFYDFFRVHELGGLSLDETRQLLIRYSDALDVPGVGRVANREPARVKVLHNLTGGNPRTIALLFNVLAAGVDGDVRNDLERLLDQSTPLYKARFEALPPQAQQVVHALAVHWDPISAAELAEQLAMDVNAVSSQLARLVKQGVVEKVAYDPESKTGFQIGERFFNIWYLMRASRRVRRRLLWLVEFLRMFYSQEQLQARALIHLQSGLVLDTARRLRHAEYGFALAGAIRDEAWSSSLQRSGVYMLAGDSLLQSQLNELIEFDDGETDLQERMEQLARLERARSEILGAWGGLPEGFAEELWASLKESLLLPLAAKLKLAEALPGMGREQVKALKANLASESERLQRQLVCTATVRALTTAVRTGIMTDLGDFEGARRAESMLNTSGLAAVALAHRLDLSQESHLLGALEEHLESATSPYPWLVWLRFSLSRETPLTPARLTRAMDRILELADDDPDVLHDLGYALAKIGRSSETEVALRKAVVAGSGSAMTWCMLGMFFVAYGRVEEAEMTLEKLGDIRPQDVGTLVALGVLLIALDRVEEAEQVIRKVIALNPADGTSWALLGVVLALSNRDEETEEAVVQAISLSSNARMWFLVGQVALARGDLARAEDAFRQAVARDRYHAEAWIALGKVLSRLGSLEEAETAFRAAVESQPGNLPAKETLAWFLIGHGGHLEAARLAQTMEGVSGQAEGIAAAALALDGRWNEAAPHARAFLTRVVWDHLSDWSQALGFFRAAIRAERAREALEVFQEMGGVERWRPLAEALRAVVRGESYLRRVAPEVREPARQILAQLVEPVRGRAPQASGAEETGPRGRRARAGKPRARKPRVPRGR